MTKSGRKAYAFLPDFVYIFNDIYFTISISVFLPDSLKTMRFYEGIRIFFCGFLITFCIVLLLFCCNCSIL